MNVLFALLILTLTITTGIGSHLIKKRKIINEFNKINNKSTRWPFKTVPYEYDDVNVNMNDDFQRFSSQQMKRKIEKAMAHWELYTCIKFEPYDSQKHKAYMTKVVFSKRTGTCAGDVGYNYPVDESRTRNNIYLSDECTVGNVIHELGHIIGFRHEHNRRDRDEHVKINPIYAKNAQVNFKIWDDGVPGYYSIPYDLYSIMHYSNMSMSALDPKREFLMGQRIGLSFLDKEMANKAYKCDENCGVKLKCQNSGFFGKNCKCVCPEQLTGQLCENVISFKINENIINLDEINNKLDCNFSNKNLCKWKIDEHRSFSMGWKFSERGQHPIRIEQIIEDGVDMSKFKFLSSPDDSSSSGSYIYNINDQKSVKEISQITTPPLITSKKLSIHLSFWYNLYENKKFRTDSNGESSFNNRTSISVNLRFSNGSVKNLWTIENNQGPEWHFADIIINLQPIEFSIFFETNRDTSILSLIAFDDIKVTNTLRLTTKVSTRKETYTKFTASILNQPQRSTNMWSEWSLWSRCIGSLPNRVRYRTRICKNLINEPCLGKSNEVEPCVAPRVFIPASKKLEKPKEVNPCGQTYFDLDKFGIGFITSPKFDKMYDRNIQCNYLVRSTKGKRIRAEVKKLDIQIYETTKKCIDSLEFRYYHLGQPGPKYCGKNSFFKIESYSNFLMIIFKSSWVQESDMKGFLIIMKTF